ncbi:MAG: hypothetical protein HY698_10510 [Deltaproteobacteria bacterium]|nr:hypothetical protein [Deltaproteobacteria bacterium]
MTASHFCPACGRSVEEVPTPDTTSEFEAPTRTLLTVGGVVVETPVRTPPEGAGDGPSCSWCGKGASAIRKLLSGPAVHICDECVALCFDILSHELPGWPMGGGGGSDPR